MKPIEQSCDTVPIDDYLAEHLPVKQQTELEEHLSGCESCRQRMEDRAAEQEVWDNARALLSFDRDGSGHESDGESMCDVGVRPGVMVLDALAPTDDPEMLGRLGEYEISGVVGVGGMGAVLRGFDKSLRRVVAIKVMAPHLAGSGSARTRFQREARAAAAITHDNIIEIYGVAESNQLPYIVMPYARGPSLQNRIDRSGPLTAIEVVRIGKQIASGLAAAHEQGLVHRDIKPANILLNEGIERLWITDFGVARAMDDVSMTNTGAIAGTPQYMSPEQARGESVDHRSDLFSLGSVLYTACTGRAPFRSEAAYGILRRITDTDPRPIREINPDIPDWLCQIITRLMAKHAGDRFHTAAEVAELLERCLAHVQQPTRVELPPSLSATDPSTAVPRQPRPTESNSTAVNLPKSRRTRPILGVLTGCLMLAATGAIAWNATAPVDLTGTWKGDSWTTVSLSSVTEATGWYNGTFTDDEGQTGAIRLEWSRIQRSYNGRWRSGDDQSGAITLRAGDEEEVRGAVSTDAESPIRADQPRLREFSWRRSNKKALPTTASGIPEWRKHVGQPWEITVPAAGVVVRLGDGIGENARVKKGELIAVLAPDDSEKRQQLESQRIVLQQLVQSAKKAVSAKESAIRTTRNHLNASELRQASFERIQREIVAGAEATIAVEAEKVEAARSQLIAFNASAEELQATHDRNKQAREKGLLSVQEVLTSESKLRQAKAQVAEAEARVRSATSEVLVKEKDRNAKEALAQVDIDDAKALVSNAKIKVVEAEGDLENAHVELAKAEKSLRDIEAKLGEVQRLEISAPQDGYITQVNIGSGKTVLNKGDTLCLFWPDQASSPTESKTPETYADRGTHSSPSATARSVLNALPATEGYARQSLMSALNTAISLAKRIRKCQFDLQSTQAALSKNPPSTDADVMQRRLSDLRDELSASEKEKVTITKMLRARLDTANQLHESQSTLTAQAAAAVKAGGISEHEFIVAKHSLAAVHRDLTLLKQLLSFYQFLGQSDAASEGKRIIQILKSQVDLTQELHSLQVPITEQLNFAFERGSLSIDEKLQAQNALNRTETELKELEVLLGHFTDLDGLSDETDAKKGPPTGN